ncbi:MAG: (2Fe-2S)-binding protein [Actinomycetes bacterium]
MPELEDVAVVLRVNGVDVSVPSTGSLLDALRDHAGVRSAKDGCAPQGQCGCCTVLVDGQARVACVTPVRRVVGREIVTLEGFPDSDRSACATALTACGGSQCGVCTPGIIVRLAALDAKRPDATVDDVHRALAAHLCRCTGWQTVVESWELHRGGQLADALEGRDFAAASRRAQIECGTPQSVGTDVALGAAGFSADAAPSEAVVAVPDGADGWVVGSTVAEARARARKVQGRRTTASSVPPLEVPAGEWAAVLATNWVDPAYVETDASWSPPAGPPSPPAANAGAFGAKRGSPVPAAAQRLAAENGRPVLAVWSREDVARHGWKRPPVAGGVRPDGTGVLRVVATPGVADAITRVAPGVTIEEVDTPGPPTSAAVRGAGWAEALVLLAAAGAASPFIEVHGDSVTVTDPNGGRATVRVAAGTVEVEVEAGDPLDEVVVRSYCIGAVHMALSWVTSESLTVSPDGEVGDLTVRSLGVLRAADMPHVSVRVTGSGDPVRASDAVFVATAAAVWGAQGYPPVWPTGTLLPATPTESGAL